jgi:anti-sigma regulatory factor (Ser/Thr protein kinase)
MARHDEKESVNDGIQARPPLARPLGKDIRHFIIENVGHHAHDISSLTAARFGITRPAVNKHLQKLVAEGDLLSVGTTRDKSYHLKALFAWGNSYPIAQELAEDRVWSLNVAPVLGKLPQNVMDIWHFCFTEMFNNAIDHSGGSEIDIQVARTAADTQMVLTDDGVGIFKKIQQALGLLDERHAVLELAKGKLTTDPARHTGQGIFFSSRLVDSFDILSGGVHFRHQFGEEEDWIDEASMTHQGTAVMMKLNNRSSRVDAEIFKQYTSGEDFGFSKTVVPVRLAQYGEDKLISRSQAKRLLARVDLFRSVWFDFTGVETIGQAFADEIFRVFVRSHPEIEFVPINATPQV